MAWDNGVSPPGGVSYAAPLMDFSEFGNLANVYRQAGFDQQRKVSNEQQQQLNQQRIQAGQQQQDIAKTFQGGLPRNADGSVDYASAVAMLAKKGDVGALWNGADVMAATDRKGGGCSIDPARRRCSDRRAVLGRCKTAAADGREFAAGRCRAGHDCLDRHRSFAQPGRHHRPDDCQGRSGDGARSERQPDGGPNSPCAGAWCRSTRRRVHQRATPTRARCRRRPMPARRRRRLRVRPRRLHLRRSMTVCFRGRRRAASRAGRSSTAGRAWWRTCAASSPASSTAASAPPAAASASTATRSATAIAKGIYRSDGSGRSVSREGAAGVRHAWRGRFGCAIHC
jgi:hypothetical protein